MAQKERQTELSPEACLEEDELKTQRREELEEDTMLKKRQSREDGANCEKIEAKNEFSEEAPVKRKKNPYFEGCNSVQNYLYLNKIHEGSFGIVFRAKDTVSGQFFALKSIKIERNSAG